jgi:hypothetical protein
VQSFVGEMMSDFRAHVHFVCPKLDDLADLMNEWMRMMQNYMSGKFIHFARQQRRSGWCSYTRSTTAMGEFTASYTSRASEF